MILVAQIVNCPTERVAGNSALLDEKNDEGSVMRVVMVGDFPRKVDEMGGGVEAVATYLANALQEFPDISLEAVTLDRWG